MKLTIPIRIESEANRRDHWTAKNNRRQDQQKTFLVYWRKAKLSVSLPCRVVFTRCASRLLDSDNLAGGFKFCRDQLAKELGIDDGSSLITFEYRQEKLVKREYFITVEIVEFSTVRG